jgi:hypothetical protein
MAKRERSAATADTLEGLLYDDEVAWMLLW